MNVSPASPPLSRNPRRRNPLEMAGAPMPAAGPYAIGRQNLMQLAQATGGVMGVETGVNLVSFEPNLNAFVRRMEHGQYWVTVAMATAPPPGWLSLPLKSHSADLQLIAPPGVQIQ